MRKLALTLVLFTAPSLLAFTQSGFGTIIGDGVPMGHEWLTRRAAIELLIGQDPLMKPDPDDPRKNWTQGLAKNLSLKGAQDEVDRIQEHTTDEDRYFSTYQYVFDTIIGERWVDIGGFNLLTSHIPKNYNCWDAVAQEPVEIQYDHHMRRFDEDGGEGGVSAAKYSQQHFMEFFVAAATAPEMKMLVWDGGVLKPELKEVDRNYFLFGRALHLFQDSFSSEHTVRLQNDTPETVRQVKSYLCALGSEQHSHDQNAVVLTFDSGDVIWVSKTRWISPDWSTYKPSNMKPMALVAMEATKDLWAAFIRTMAVPPTQRKAKAQQEAQTLVNNWLSFNAQEMQGWYINRDHRGDTYVFMSSQDGQNSKGQTQHDCMVKLQVPSGKQADKVKQLEHDQRVCLFNMEAVPGYSDLFDPEIHSFFNWQWTSLTSWNIPKPEWKIPNHFADRGRRETITSMSRALPMTALLPLENNRVVETKNLAPVHFILVSASDDPAKVNDEVFLRARFAPHLFLSYNATPDGTVKLWKGTTESSYKLSPAAGNAMSIMNLHHKQYIWTDDAGGVFLTSKGKHGNKNAQWKFAPQP